MHWGRQTRGKVRTDHKKDSKQWQEGSNAQVGYGEIRPVRLLKVDNFVGVGSAVKFVIDTPKRRSYDRLG